MRDLALFVVIFGLLPLVLRHPQVGVYLWSWLSYMNPHRMTWGMAYDFPFAQVVALTTMVSYLAWKGDKSVPTNGLMVVWGLFVSWMCISTVFAYYPELAWEKLSLVLKIQLVTLTTVALIKNKKDLDRLLWVVVLSIGFFSIKGGVFTLIHLGAYRVWGPDGSFIADNNALAVASFMIVPIMFYLRSQSDNRLIKMLVLGGIALTVVSAFGSQSRGALIAAGATGVYFWWKSPNKFITGLAVIVLGAGILAFMPDTWWARMYTIVEYEEDASAMGRLAAWKLAINVANANFLGGGFNFWGPKMFQLFSNNPDDWGRNMSAHSIYFTCLGEHGWVGLLLFILVFVLGWRTAGIIIRESRGIPELRWLTSLMRLLQVSLISYASGGAFLNLAYFDLPWHLISFIVVGRLILDRHTREARIPASVPSTSLDSSSSPAATHAPRA